ncbi:MAG TPA: LuxR C-terminal-related transcriptional regulator [Candidatus Sulfotelmatobacter sp.]|nr:LuxR C-terminal-related transcriptional regulator [Candidatus Sulfotelmatobacter sp.]
MAKPAVIPTAHDVSLIDVATSAFYDAEYERALAALALLPDDEAVRVETLLLRARTHLRSGDPVAGGDAAMAAAERADTPDARVSAAALRGAALRARRKPREAAAAFAAAAAMVNDASADARAEYAFHAATAAWEDGELQAAEQLVEAALPDARDVWRARLTRLLGAIEMRRERYAAAAEHFLEALHVLAGAPREDLFVRARLIHGLATIASETIDLRLAKRYAPYLSATRWTSGVARQHTGTLGCERILALLRGDVGAAWQLARDAVYAAPTDARRAIAETNAAALSALVGDEFAARAQFDSAWSLIDGVSWAKVDDGERLALTNFAIEAAEAMPGEARTALALYRNLSGAPEGGGTGDRRLPAFEAMALGRVSEVAGRPKEAIEHYERARGLWVALDFRVRAALVARDLQRLTGQERYQHDVDVALSRAPYAWFGQAPPAPPASAALAKLTPAERTVLRYLLGGENMKGIARALDRSPYTVHNHTRRIFGAFEVRARAALIARCAELGITADKLA